MVVCLERGEHVTIRYDTRCYFNVRSKADISRLNLPHGLADLHTAQLMPLPLTVSCFSEIQIGFTFVVPAHLGSPEKRAVKVKRVCM